MLNWDYAARGERMPRTAEFVAAGLPVMVCPGTGGWTTHGSRLENAMGNVAHFAGQPRPFRGLIDEVRIHRNVYRLWEREDMAWARKNDDRPIPASAPFFVPSHVPALYLPLDGDTKPALSTIEGLMGDEDVEVRSEVTILRLFQGLEESPS
jgi:hypothetical protein